MNLLPFFAWLRRHLPELASFAVMVLVAWVWLEHVAIGAPPAP